ncbi:putative polypeptide N-acetylgalactosaminyltransferase 13 [Drosophila nasuta]|uniref:putative polypeptide N-acetylgalactosaminyltransferase 13 n=1 Tax=Drosophila nasuta TaxID=42062 RepID=UPI00295E858F|nr:putative polypeptide N-acetylgalactosaminyltransferase 13 [Drosophila nasuta]
MSGGRRQRLLLNLCVVFILACLLLQLTVLRATVDDTELDLTSDLQHDYLDVEWREFIAHTPEQPDTFFQYNRQLSDKLAAVRSLPMTRHDSCNTRNYQLPHASAAQLSVVISFHNEARSILLRTICTLISRTSHDYLHELIIIDDCSDDDELLVSLDGILRRIFHAHPAFIFRRNRQRRGLIWSRNEGARVASGHYLLFLDSHCEVNAGWLEPLLDRLALNSSRAVSPLLDPIDPETLSYLAGNVLLKGGFDWSLHFHWLPRQFADGERAEEAYKSPAFAGGIMMISREWFFKLQGFNPHLQIWGGESIEFAIKLWLCGGQIEIVPCSRIGHIFRSRHAFEFPAQFEELEEQQQQQQRQQQLDTAQATYLRNSKIIAESWLDEYKYLFYTLKPAAKQIPLNLSQHELASIKTGQRCQRFDWFLRHLQPDLKVHNAKFSALGTLRNEDRCLHVEESQLLLVNCYRMEITQWRLHRNTGQLSTGHKRCLGVLNESQLSMQPCLVGALINHTQRWQRRDTQLLHSGTHLCLDNPLKNQLALSSCRALAASQSFQFALEMEAQTN